MPFDTAWFTVRVRVYPWRVMVYAGSGTVWENPTRGIPVLNPDFTGTPRGLHGLHEDSTRTPRGLHGDSTGTPWGLHGDSTGTPWGLHGDSMRTPRGLHGDSPRLWRDYHDFWAGYAKSMRSPWGVHGNVWGTVKYSLLHCPSMIYELLNPILSVGVIHAWWGLLFLDVSCNAKTGQLNLCFGFGKSLFLGASCTGLANINVP